MCKYENKTDKEAIEKKIAKLLELPDNATAVMAAIDRICEGEEVENDRVSQWLRLLREAHIEAGIVAGKHPFPLIEIYPNGTKGPGKGDRMFLEIRDTDVEVIGAGLARHK